MILLAIHQPGPQRCLGHPQTATATCRRHHPAGEQLSLFDEMTQLENRCVIDPCYYQYQAVLRANLLTPFTNQPSVFINYQSISPIMFSLCEQLKIIIKCQLLTIYNHQSPFIIHHHPTY